MRYSLLLISSLATLNFFTSAVPFVHQGSEVANQGLAGVQSPVAIHKRGDDDDDDDWEDDWDHDDKDDDEDCDDEDEDHWDHKDWEKDSVWEKDYKDWDKDYYEHKDYEHEGHKYDDNYQKKGRKTKTVYFVYTVTTTNNVVLGHAHDEYHDRNHDGRCDWDKDHGLGHLFDNRLNANVPSPTMASIAATRTPLANPVVATT